MMARRWWRLQSYETFDWDGRTLRQYREMYDAFFEQRPLIPADQFHEVGFEELEADPIGEISRLYDALQLPDFCWVEQKLRSYVGSVSGYKKNAFPELPADQQKRVSTEWRRCFDAWGYRTSVDGAQLR
jgi:hypothetical protein